MRTKANPFYKGQRAPSIDFDEVRDNTRAEPQFIDVDLASARTVDAPLILNVSGNSLFIDQKANSGSAQIIFQEQFPARPCAITVFPGFVARVPFTQLSIINAAQPGQTLRIVYGVDIDFVPTTSAGVTITASTTPFLMSDSGFTAGVNFASSSILTALTAQNVIAAASNTAGLLVHAAAMTGGDTTGTGIHPQSLLAKATAPATTSDGIIIAQTFHSFVTGATIFGSGGYMVRAVNVPAALRLDFIDGSTQNLGPLRHVAYTIK